MVRRRSTPAAPIAATPAAAAVPAGAASGRLAEVGRRRAYYPVTEGPREDAILMSLSVAVA